MIQVETALELFKGAWPAIQPAISTAFGAVVANLFLKSNTSKSEIEKLKQAKFSEIADKLLEGGHITHLEYYKCRNFNKIAQKADEVYQKQSANQSVKFPGGNDKQFTLDWFVRFFEDAGNISDEVVQELWAKVLAGEIFQPSSFSLRTLDTLKNLSRSEAEVAQELCSYAIQVGDEYVLCIDEELLSRFNYQKKLRLCQEVGLIENNIACQYTISFQKNWRIVRGGAFDLISNEQAKSQLCMKLQRFTAIGNEFLNLVSPDNNYMSFLMEYLQNTNSKLNLIVEKRDGAV